MVSFSYHVYNQIRLLISAVTKKNFRATVTELKELFRLYGDDARLFLLRTLVEDLDFHDKSHKDQFKLQLLAQELSDLAARPNFASILCRSLEPHNINAEYLVHFIRSLKLQLALQLQLAMGLIHSSHEPTRQEGITLLRAKLSEAFDANAERLPELLVLELSFFIRSSEIFPPRVRFQIIQTLQMQYPETHHLLSSPLLAPFQARKPPSDNISPNLVHQLRNHATHVSDLLQDLGYSAMQSSDKLEQVLAEFPSVTEVDTARMIAMMVRTATGLADDPSLNLIGILTGQQRVDSDVPVVSWNAGVFVSTLQRLVPRLNWQLVFRTIDLHDFVVTDRRSLELFLEIFSLANKGVRYPVESLFTEWRNKAAQASLLHALVAYCTPAFDLVDFRNSPHVQPPIEGMSHTLIAPAFAAQPTDAPESKSVPSTVDEATYLRHCHAWLSLDVVDTLFALSESSPDLYHLVRRTFGIGLDKCPELLLSAIVLVPGRNVALRDELLSLLVPMFLQQHPNSPAVLQRVWQTQSGASIIVRGMVGLYSTDRTFSQRVVDIANELRDSLTIILEARPFTFSIDVAAQAARRGMMDLGKWLQLRLAEHNGSFAASCLEYLKESLSRFDNKSVDPTQTGTSPTASAGFSSSGESKAPDLQDPAFSKQAISTFFRTLLSAAGSLPTETATEIERVHAQYSQVMPELTNSESDAAVDDVIAHRANTIFQKVYSEQISLLDAIATLKRFKNSENPVDREVYACMIHNLFDEYRFFPTYPLDKLHITGLLFGLLIQHQVVTSYTLGIALRYILEALRKPEDSKVFKFGMWALDQFKGRLHQWPQYCRLVHQIPHLRTAQPEIAEALDRILSQQPEAGATSDSLGPSDNLLLGTPRTQNDLGASPTDQTFGDKSGDSDTIGTGLDSARSRDSSPMVNPQASPSMAGLSAFVSSSPPPRSLPPGMGLAPGVQNTGSSTGLFGGMVSGPGGVPIGVGASVPFANPNPSPSPTASPSPAPINNVAPFAAPSSPLGPTGSSSASNTPMKGRDDPSRALPGTPLKPRNIAGSFASGQVNLDTLMPTQTVPNEALEDKIHFIVNNVTKANLKAKAKELKAVLKPEHYPFFARYLVVKRVAAETNQHKLYAAFLETFGAESLNKIVLDTTYENVKILLNNDKCLHSVSERSLLKNLGSWLGLLTIAKRKPILAKRIDLKELILDSYDHGRFIAVIPFIGKVLEPAGKSRVFKPPNPWIMALVAVLREIYDLPGLKLNLKFEIEMLATHLGVKMKDIKPTNLLRARQVRTPGIPVNVSSRTSVSTAPSVYTPPPIPSGHPPGGPVPPHMD
jgi:CCR4-NOT transcription complex subunit 1